MSESESHSVTNLIKRVQADESQAAHELWQRSLEKMIRDARRSLKRFPRRAVDEEDVVNEVFAAFLQKVKENGFDKLEGRGDLWQILAMLAERKANSILRWELAKKRGGGNQRGESAFEQLDPYGSALPGIGGVVEPHPKATEQLPFAVRELLGKLDDDDLRRVAMDRLARYTYKEIAERMGISMKTVERKVKLIREIWKQELEADEAAHDLEGDDE